MKSSRASYADLRACGAGMPEQYLFCTDNSKIRQVTWRHPPTTAASGGPSRAGSNPTCYLVISKGLNYLGTLLAVISIPARYGSGGACIPSAVTRLPALPRAPAPADRRGPRQACGHPRLLRTHHVAARLLQHHFLRRGVGHGRVNAEIHQVGQHPDRLVPLPRLLLVVAVDQHPPSFQGTGPL